MNALSKAASLDHLERLGRNPSSVSPGNPTMMSVDTAMWGIAGADALEPPQVTLAAVGTMHRLEHGVGAGLQGEVDVLAHPLALGHRLDHVGREIVGVRTGEPDPPQIVNLVDFSKQPREQGLLGRARDGDVATVGVHVLPEQGDLDDAVGRQALHLGEDVADRARALRPANQRDDAERAGVVTARRDRDPGAERVVARCGQGARERFGVLAHIHLGPIGLRLLQQVEQLRQGVGPDHDIDPGGLALDQPLVLLCQTPRDHDLELGVAVLDRLEVAQVAVQLVVGVLADRARVEHDDPRLVGILGGRHAVGHEQARDPLGIVFVHLAPEGADQVLRFHLLRVAERGAPTAQIPGRIPGHLRIPGQIPGMEEVRTFHLREQGSGPI